MSLFELFIVLLVGLLVVKPEDFPKIIAKFKEVRNFITNTKRELISQIDPDLNPKQSVDDLKKEVDQMNFYLEKIANLGSEFEGEYSLFSVKEHYHKIVRDQMKASELVIKNRT